MEPTLPKGKYTQDKLKAYKRHWKEVNKVRDEFSNAYIHDGVSVSDVASESGLGRDTVGRFFAMHNRGKYKAYSYFFGPTFTTVVGIGSALGLEFKLVRTRGNAKKVQETRAASGNGASGGGRIRSRKLRSRALAKHGEGT